MGLLNVSYIFILCLCYAESLHELCAKTSFQNVNCKKQLWVDTQNKGDCEVKYYKTNSSECSELDFHHDTDSTADLGDVQIMPFVWDYKDQHSLYFTLFNVIFSNIRWNHVKFRFESKGENNSKGYKNHCREILIKTNESLKNISSLNYDCHWSDQDRRYQNEKYYFDYEATGSKGVSRGRYIFIVPAVKTLTPVDMPEDWEPFVYLNVINPQHVNIHVLSSNKDILVDRYIIKVHRALLKTNSLNRDSGCNISSLPHIRGHESIYSYTIPSSGWYTFEITPISPNCFGDVCKSVFSPTINIEQDKIVYSILWITLVFTAVWIPIIVWLIFGSTTKKFRPNVLIIHPPGNKMDAEVTDLLGQYFISELNWKVMWKKDIKLTEHNDPYMWCIEAFDKADVVLYIVNPYSKDNNIDYVETNIYRNLDQILLKHVRNDTLNCPIVNILFEHYKTRQVPDELKHMKTFRLLRDWFPLLRFIMHFNTWDRIKHPLPKLRASKIGKQLCAHLDTR